MIGYVRGKIIQVEIKAEAIDKRKHFETGIKFKPLASHYKFIAPLMSSSI